MSVSPQVTVAMAAYNAAATVMEAVQSIIWQSFQDWELVIAEDGSTDATLAVLGQLDDPRIRVLSDGRNCGKPVRMNQIIDAAGGSLLAIMDADDISYPGRLAQQVEYLNAHPDIDLLATGMTTFDDMGNLGRWRRLRTTHEEIARHPWLGFHFNSPTWMGRTSWFRRHRYREDLRAAEDEDLLLRAAATSRLSALESMLLAYRIDQWNWGKAVRMRRDHVRSLTRASIEQRDPRPLAGVMVHGAKLLREGLAVATGLEHSLLSHRALPLTEVDERQLRDLRERLANRLADKGAS